MATDKPISAVAAPEVAMMKIGLHDYLSTACLHGNHAECRVVCKFCSAECRCDCGHTGSGEVRGNTPISQECGREPSSAEVARTASPSPDSSVAAPGEPKKDSEK